MPSSAKQSHSSRAQSHEFRNRNDLEDNQSTIAEMNRFAYEGSNADLTELAAPAPVLATEPDDDLEKREKVVSQDARHDKFINDNDEGLTELALPEPVERSSSSQYSQSRANLDDQEKAEQVVCPAVTRQASSTTTELYTASWLIFFSLLGTLARMGIEAITTYPYASFPSTVLWANLGGSLFLGFLLEDRRLFRPAAISLLKEGEESEHNAQIDRTKKTLPLYIGLATGFCGCFTSFSTFITDAFLALSDNLAPASPASPYSNIAPIGIQPRNVGYNLEAVLAILIVHPMISIGALKTGAHLAIGMEGMTPALPTRLIARYLDRLIIPVSLGCWFGSVLLSIWPGNSDWRERATLALVFSPPGCLLRFYAGKHLNARVPAFPLGTFAVNIFGTCVEGMLYDLQHTSRIIGRLPAGQANVCAVLEGLMQGFCGSATTVSTWVAELNGLRRRHGWLYGLMTVIIALGLQIVIMGSVAWTRGFDEKCTTIK